MFTFPTFPTLPTEINSLIDQFVYRIDYLEHRRRFSPVLAALLRVTKELREYKETVILDNSVIYSSRVFSIEGGWHYRSTSHIKNTSYGWNIQHQPVYTLSDGWWIHNYDEEEGRVIYDNKTKEGL